MSTIDPAAAEPQTAAPSSRPRVAILFGGRSSEHSISLVTARGVLGAIDREHWDVVTVGIARTGEWFLFSQDELEALLDENPITELPVGEQMVSLPMGSGDTELLIRDISGEGPAQERREHIDVVGAALLGLRGLVFKSHGSADEVAFEQALNRAYDAARNNLLDRVRRRIASAAPFLLPEADKTEADVAPAPLQ